MTTKKTSKRNVRPATPAEKIEAIVLLKSHTVAGDKFKLPPPHFGPKAMVKAKSTRGWINAFVLEVRPIKRTGEMEVIARFNTEDLTDAQILGIARQLHDILCKGVDEGIGYMRGKAIHDELQALVAKGGPEGRAAAQKLKQTREQVARARAAAGASVSPQLLDALIDHEKETKQ